MTRISTEELVAEFEHTWSRHRGSITLAAAIFGFTPSGLAKALLRAKKRGIEVTYTYDVKKRAA